MHEACKEARTVGHCGRRREHEGDESIRVECAGEFGVGRAVKASRRSRGVTRRSIRQARETMASVRDRGDAIVTSLRCWAAGCVAAGHGVLRRRMAMLAGAHERFGHTGAAGSGCAAAAGWAGRS